MTKSFITKTRWLVTIILLLSLSITNAWGAVNNGDLFERISAAPSSGDEVIIVNQGEAVAMSTTQNGNNRDQTSITTSSHQYIYASTDNVQVLTVKVDGTYYGFHTSGGSTGGFLNQPSNYNYLRTTTAAYSTSLADATKWSLSVSSSVFTIRSKRNTAYYLQYNSSSSIFSSYKYTQANPSIYKKVCSAPTALTKGTITANSVELTITDGADVYDYEIYHSTGSSAPTASSTATKTTTSKSYTLDGLSANTTYYVWVRSKCSASRKTGWIALTGNSFKTSAASCTTNATVSAGSLKGSVSSSSSATAQCTGGITSLGSAGCSITSYGFAVGTSTNPTIGGTLTGTGKTYEVGTSYTTVNTAFEKLIDGLSASTKYYVRPYATNGNGTAYGSEFNFTTLAACTAAPTVTAGSTGTVTSTTAVVNCSSGLSALGTGGCTVTSYGFVYGTSENPTTSNSTNEVGTSYTTTGTSFNTTLTSLTEGQLYYVRPYATNGYGTGYGTQTSFGTPKITTSLSTRNFGDRKVNGGPYTMTFKVSGVYLQSDISIAKSGTNQAMFSIDKATISQTDGTAAETTITVSYSPTAAGSHSATLTLTSTNATSKTVTLTGTGKWEVTWDVSGSSPTTTLVANSTKPTLPDPAGITSCDGTSTTFIGWTKTPWVGKQNQTYIDGLTGDDVVHTDNTTMSNVTANGTTYYAVFAQASGGTPYYQKVTSTGDIASDGRYLIVYEDGNIAFNGELTSLDATSNYISVATISSSKITPADAAARTAHAAAEFTIDKTNLYVKSASNKYINHTGWSNGLTGSDGTSAVHSISIDGSGDLIIEGTGNSNGTYVILRYNKASDQKRFRFYKATGTDVVAVQLYKYYPGVSYSNYLTTCCNMPTLAFGASPYAVIRQDIQGASTTTWAEVDVTFTSNNTTGAISATTYTDSKTVYSLSTWQSRATTGGSLCATTQAYFEVLTQPSGETPGTGKFHVKTTSGQTGQGTYRIAITQASTDEDHGNFCEKTVYGFVDVTLRDKFVDKLNDNGTVNKDGHGAQLATPLLSELGTQVENACHSEGRKLKGWIKETDLKSKYETGNSERVQTIDGLCETCDNAADWTSLIVAPGTNVTMSGATWYAVWAYER